MRWITHQAGAVLAISYITLSPLTLLSAPFGAIIPDAIDQYRCKLHTSKRQKVFNQIHRGASHWFGWWLITFMGTLMYFHQYDYIFDILLGLSLGALSHVGMDFLTPKGVPLLPFTRKFSVAVPICVTGSWREWLFLAVITSLTLVYRLNEYFL